MDFLSLCGARIRMQWITFEWTRWKVFNHLLYASAFEFSRNYLASEVWFAHRADNRILMKFCPSARAFFRFNFFLPTLLQTLNMVYGLCSISIVMCIIRCFQTGFFVRSTSLLLCATATSPKKRIYAFIKRSIWIHVSYTEKNPP